MKNSKLVKKEKNQDYDFYHMSHSEEIDYMRATGIPTWIKERHLKKYLNSRYDAHNYQGY